MADEDDILQQIERRSREQTDRVRQFILAEGRPDVLAEFDGKMRDIRLGIDGAQRTWESISDAQRRVLVLLGEGRHLRRSHGSKTRYDAIGMPHGIRHACGVPTARNLCARELCHVDGGAMDPESKIVLTERGRFVLKHGPK